MIKIWKEFKEFAIKGNALELAVGVVIGAAFGQIINSLANDIIIPLLGFFTGPLDFGNLQINFFGNALRYGAFLNAVINFLVISLAVFFVIKEFNRFRKHPTNTPNTKECPYCKTAIALQATRCPACTSQLN